MVDAADNQLKKVFINFTRMNHSRDSVRIPLICGKVIDDFGRHFAERKDGLNFLKVLIEGKVVDVAANQFSQLA